MVAQGIKIEALAFTKEQIKKGTREMTTFTTQDRQDAQRTPLSEFEIKGILAQSECWIGEDSSMPNFIAFARAIERAHGIGE